MPRIKHLPYLFIYISQDTANRISRVVKKGGKKKEKISRPTNCPRLWESFRARSRVTKFHANLPRALDPSLVTRRRAFELQKSWRDCRVTKGETNGGEVSIGRVYSREKLLPNFCLETKVPSIFFIMDSNEIRGHARRPIPRDNRNENECFLERNLISRFVIITPTRCLLPSLSYFASFPSDLSVGTILEHICLAFFQTKCIYFFR